MTKFNYKHGLRFHCTKCGLCCGDTPSRVRQILMLKQEAERISKVTSKPIEEFAAEIKDHEPYVYEMKKTTKKGKCTFLEDSICTIYVLRPLICRFYPFELWKSRTGRYTFLPTEECEGIGKGKQLKKEYYEKLFQQACDQLREEQTEGQ